MLQLLLPLLYLCKQVELNACNALRHHIDCQIGSCVSSCRPSSTSRSEAPSPRLHCINSVHTYTPTHLFGLFVGFRHASSRCNSRPGSAPKARRTNGQPSLDDACVGECKQARRALQAYPQPA
jgi:hypothetical protein